MFRQTHMRTGAYFAVNTLDLEQFYREKKTWGEAQWGQYWEAGVYETSSVLIHRNTDPEASGQLQKVRSGNREGVRGEQDGGRGGGRGEQVC